MPESTKVAHSLCTCGARDGGYCKLLVLPAFRVVSRMALILQKQSLEANVLGVCTHDDVVCIKEQQEDWVRLPANSRVRRKQGDRGQTVSLANGGWMLIKHAKYGTLLRRCTVEETEAYATSMIELRNPSHLGHKDAIEAPIPELATLPKAGSSRPRTEWSKDVEDVVQSMTESQRIPGLRVTDGGARVEATWTDSPPKTRSISSDSGSDFSPLHSNSLGSLDDLELAENERLHTWQSTSEIPRGSLTSLDHSARRFEVLAPIVLVLEEKSLNARVLGVCIQKDQVITCESDRDWVQLPPGSRVRQKQGSRTSTIVLEHGGWMLTQHDRYGQLLSFRSTYQIPSSVSDQKSGTNVIIQEETAVAHSIELQSASIASDSSHQIDNCLDEHHDMSSSSATAAASVKRWFSLTGDSVRDTPSRLFENTSKSITKAAKFFSGGGSEERCGSDDQDDVSNACIQEREGTCCDEQENGSRGGKASSGFFGRVFSWMGSSQSVGNSAHEAQDESDTRNSPARCLPASMSGRSVDSYPVAQQGSYSEWDAVSGILYTRILAEPGHDTTFGKSSQVQGMQQPRNAEIDCSDNTSASSNNGVKGIAETIDFVSNNAAQNNQQGAPTTPSEKDEHAEKTFNAGNAEISQGLTPNRLDEDAFCSVTSAVQDVDASSKVKKLDCRTVFMAKDTSSVCHKKAPESQLLFDDEISELPPGVAREVDENDSRATETKDAAWMARIEQSARPSSSEKDVEEREEDEAPTEAKVGQPEKLHVVNSSIPGCECESLPSDTGESLPSVVNLDEQEIAGICEAARSSTVEPIAANKVKNGSGSGREGQAKVTSLTPTDTSASSINPQLQTRIVSLSPFLTGSLRSEAIEDPLEMVILETDNVLVVKRLLHEKLGIPMKMKILSKHGRVTLNDSEQPRKDLLVRGVPTLRSPVTILQDDALKMIGDISNGLAGSEVQMQVRSISEQFQSGNTDLQRLKQVMVEVVQRVVPKYGFEESPDGVQQMQKALAPYQHLQEFRDAATRNRILLGLQTAPSAVPTPPREDPVLRQLRKASKGITSQEQSASPPVESERQRRVRLNPIMVWEIDICERNAQRLAIDAVVSLLHRRIYIDNRDELWGGRTVPSRTSMYERLLDSSARFLCAAPRAGDSRDLVGGAVVETRLIRTINVSSTTWAMSERIPSPEDVKGVDSYIDLQCAYVDCLAAHPGTHAGTALWDYIEEIAYARGWTFLVLHSIRIPNTLHFWKKRGCTLYDSSRVDHRETFNVGFYSNTACVLSLTELEEQLPRHPGCHLFVKFLDRPPYNS